MAFLQIILLMKDSSQQQNHFNGKSFGNKCYRCNEGSLCLLVSCELLRTINRVEFPLGDWIHLVDNQPFCTREITFVTSCFSSLHTEPLLKGVNA